MSKVVSLPDAVREHVVAGSSLYVAGFSHLIAFAAAHEVIRQGIKDLELIRATPDLVYDQMVAAGCARKVTFSWAGNPGVGMLRAIRRASERGELELEEYTHHQMVGALRAGATGVPFYPLVAGSGGELIDHNPGLATVSSPFGDETVTAVRAIRPDVTIVHAQRADAEGNTQVWGITGDIKEAAFAARKVIVTVEEIVPTEVVRRDPNRTLVPGVIVDAVVHVPFGAHPSFAQGYYDRDNETYKDWNEVSKDPSTAADYLSTWVTGVPDRSAYVATLGDRLEQLKPTETLSDPVNYGTT